MMNESISNILFKILFFFYFLLEFTSWRQYRYWISCKIMDVCTISLSLHLLTFISIVSIEILTTISSCLVWQMEQLLNSWITRRIGSFEFAKIFHVTITMPLFNCNHNVEFPLYRASSTASSTLLALISLEHQSRGLFDKCTVVDCR